MAINGKGEARVARDGNQAESVANVARYIKTYRHRINIKLTVDLLEHLQQRGKRWGHQDMCLRR